MCSIKRDQSICYHQVDLTDRSRSLRITKKNAEHILIDMVYFTRSTKVDFTWIDRSLIVDQSIPCP
ncbi:unnamed protein product, partial [Brassica rapa]